MEELGYEFVDLEWGGSDARPILRLRVDRSDSSPGNGIVLEDCVRVSRAVEPWLDAFAALPERYTLEVSSPGIERPLIRRRDFVRFTGSDVSVQLKAPVPETGGAARFEAVLEGVVDERDGVASVDGGSVPSSKDAPYAVSFRLNDGQVLRVEREDVFRARIRYRWDEEE